VNAKNLPISKSKRADKINSLNAKALSSFACPSESNDDNLQSPLLNINDHFGTSSNSRPTYPQPTFHRPYNATASPAKTSKQPSTPNSMRLSYAKPAQIASEMQSRSQIESEFEPMPNYELFQFVAGAQVGAITLGDLASG
jgi:hypothetical protein